MTTKCMSKLSVRKVTIFKKPSKKGRDSTFLKKAFELSELCGVYVCIICFDREGNLLKTWPDDESKVRAMAERFSRLDVQERNKKSTNLSRFLNKKMKASFKDNNNRFLQKLLTIESSLKSLQEKLQRPLHQPHDQDQDQTLVISADHPSTTEIPANLATTSSSSLNLPRSALPSFQQPAIPYNQDYGTTSYLDLLLGDQGMRGCSNNFNLPPLMQTQTPIFQQFDHQFMQT